MAAITRTLAPFVIMFSTWETWVGMSSSAYWRSVSYPRALSDVTRLSPSAIQRADDLVGIAMPTRPLPAAFDAASLAPALAAAEAGASAEAGADVAGLLPPHAATTRAPVARATVRNFFIGALRSSCDGAREPHLPASWIAFEGADAVRRCRRGALLSPRSIAGGRMPLSFP